MSNLEKKKSETSLCPRCGGALKITTFSETRDGGMCGTYDTPSSIGWCEDRYDIDALVCDSCGYEDRISEIYRGRTERYD